MGIVEFDVERLREVAVKLCDEKISDEKLCRSKNEVFLSQAILKQLSTKR